MFFRATISQVTDQYRGQWNVALTELEDDTVLAAWEAGHTETRTPNVTLSSISTDGGRTWGQARVFRQRAGVRSTPGGFFEFGDELHCVYNELPLAGQPGKCRILDCVSADRGRTWGEPRQIRTIDYGSALQPVVLRRGKVALPLYHVVAQSDGHSAVVAYVLLSGDGGRSWRETAMIPCAVPPGPMEPAMAECDGGEWLCLLRTRGTARVYAARSRDQGQTWSSAAPLPLESPESIARLVRLHDGSLLVVWNGVGSGRQGPRTPLTAARSHDGGHTWPERRDLACGPPSAVYSNHGVLQLRGGTVLTAYQDLHLDPIKAPERSGVDSVELMGFNMEWLRGGADP